MACLFVNSTIKNRFEARIPDFVVIFSGFIGNLEDTGVSFLPDYFELRL